MNLNTQGYYNAIRPDPVGHWTLRVQLRLLFPKRR